MGCTHSIPEMPEPSAQPLNRYSSLGAVQRQLREAGLETANLILGLDFDKQHSTLYYPDAIRVLTQTLEPFMDSSSPIHGFGLGGYQQFSKSLCFPLAAGTPLYGASDLLARYSELAQSVQFESGQSWAPVVQRAVEVVRRTGRFHVLLLVGSSPQSMDSAAVKAITEAAGFPLSVVHVGFGGGDWSAVERLADRGLDEADYLSARAHDSFSFVQFNEAVGRYHECSLPSMGTTVAWGDADCPEREKSPAKRLGTLQAEARFAWEVLQGLPAQYKSIETIGLHRTWSGWKVGEPATKVLPFPRAIDEKSPTSSPQPTMGNQLKAEKFGSQSWGVARVVPLDSSAYSSAVTVGYSGPRRSSQPALGLKKWGELRGC